MCSRTAATEQRALAAQGRAVATARSGLNIPLPKGPARTPLDLPHCDGDHEMGILNSGSGSGERCPAGARRASRLHGAPRAHGRPSARASACRATRSGGARRIAHGHGRVSPCLTWPGTGSLSASSPHDERRPPPETHSGPRGPRPPRRVEDAPCCLGNTLTARQLGRSLQARCR